MNVYNLKNLKNKQRFQVAIIVAIVSAIAFALLYAIVKNMLHMHIPYLYIAFAYGISELIKKVGRGVAVKFSYLGAIATALCIVLTYFFYFILFYGVSDIAFILQYIIRDIFTLNISGLIEIGLIIYSIYLAYYNSRII